MKDKYQLCVNLHDVYLYMCLCLWVFLVYVACIFLLLFPHDSVYLPRVFVYVYNFIYNL
jgi:hypothetical protein